MGSPAVQTTAKRQFAAQAAVARSERELVKAEPLKVSTLKNGLNVASIENHSPITTLGVILKAGSRSDTHDNAGISHALRIAAGLGTKTKTAFSCCRECWVWVPVSSMVLGKANWPRQLGPAVAMVQFQPSAKCTLTLVCWVQWLCVKQHRLARLWELWLLL